MAWVPMQPFTLSMTAENAVLFMQGAFQLFVCIDLKVLVSHFASLGVHAIALMDGVTALARGRVKPSLYLRPIAQTISNTPAIAR